MFNPKVGAAMARWLPIKLVAHGLATGLVRARALLGGEDRERARQLEVISEVSRIVNSSLEMPAILRAVAVELSRVIAFVRLNFSFYDAAADTIIQHHVFARDWETVRPPLVLAARNTSAWRAMQARKTLYAPDVRQSPVPRHQELAAEGVLCTVSVPILREGRSLGALSIDGERPHAFSPSQVRFLEALAAHLSVAVDNARLFAELRHELIEHQRTEQALQEHRDFLQAVIDAVPDPIFVKDEQHRWKLGNRAFWTLFALDPGTALGKSDREFLPADEAVTFWDNDNLVLRTGETHENEEALTDGEGRTRHVLTKKSRFIDAAGHPVLVGVIRDISERKQLEAQMNRLAYYDQLSGLPNRALFLDRLGLALARSARSGRSVAVFFLDLDNFKVINDSLGHEVGDRLLAAVAGRLRSSIRAGDTAARFGGDEFAVLLEDVGGAEYAREAADRIVASLHVPIVIDTHELCPSFSIGVTVSNPDSDTVEEMLRQADLAMYRAKANGKAQYAVFDQAMAIDAMDRLTLESELRQALARDQLFVEYQPIVKLDTGRITEVEALLRWDHPTLGLVSPSRFIPVAEETGLIVPIGQWVLEQTCRQAQSWRREQPSAADLIMSVNLSARQFRHPELVASVARILHDTGLEPGALKLEITESIVMQHMNSAIATMHQLKALGGRLAIDDFGTGYSSLSYLQRFPVDTLKIDGSFVHGFNRDQRDMAIVRSVIALARGLDLTVTAEGIETVEQLHELQALGCDHGQGFFLARPVPARVITNLLAAGDSLLRPLVDPAATVA